jgi:hypothetical protein
VPLAAAMTKLVRHGDALLRVFGSARLETRVYFLFPRWHSQMTFLSTTHCQRAKRARS